MKKFYILLIFFSLCTISFAQDSASCVCKNPNCPKSCSKNLFVDECNKNQSQCDRCLVEDDEYCVYNQCYFDRHYRLMKKKLCLSDQQESNIDLLYKKFKSDMETLCSRYRVQKNRILEMIDCQNKCYKEELPELKCLKSQMKSRVNSFKNDIEQQLCDNQIKTFRKIKRREKRKMKKIIKYGAIYKLPCRSYSD